MGKKNTTYYYIFSTENCHFYIYKNRSKSRVRVAVMSYYQSLGVTSHTPIDILNKLNGYFANISDRLKASSPNNSQRKNYFKKLKNYIDNLIPRIAKFKIPFMQENELITTIIRDRNPDD